MTGKQKSPLRPVELAAFCNQLSMLVQAGISVRESIAILQEDAASDADSRLLQQISQTLETGGSLSSALGSCGVFPRYMLDMVEIGEQSGRLDEVLTALCDYYEREHATRTALRQAVTYPAVMLLMLLVVILVLSVRVLPVFSQVFSMLGAQVSGFAQGVLSTGAILGRISFVLVALFAAAVLALVVLRATAPGRQLLAGFFARFSVTRRTSQKIASGRFCSAMALLLSSGVDVDRALEMAAQLVDHPEMSRRTEQCRAQIQAGSPFAEAVGQSGILTRADSRMVAVGFRTGAVERVFEQLARRQEEEIDAELSRLVGIIEPSLVAVLSVVVGVILLSVMLPLMGIMSSIG